MSRPEFDALDETLRLQRLERRDAIPGPRVGDFCRLLDGSLRRFTYDWDDRIQTTCHNSVGATDQSFYIHSHGVADFSGSLDSAIPKIRFVLTSETMEGRFWFFHHDWAQAHNGVGCVLPCRVYQEREFCEVVS